MCYNPDWYGANPGRSGGLRLFAGGLDGLVQEYVWTLDESDWQPGFSFEATNGYAGVSCWPPGNTTYLYLQNSNSHIEAWWKDFDTSQKGGNSHPTGVWTKGKEHQAFYGNH